MAKIIPMELISDMSGKVCKDAKHAFRHAPSGYICTTHITKRNLSERPYSDDELAQQDAFRSAVSKTKLALATSTSENTWRTKFLADKDSGLTTCNTFRGYLMSQAFAGHISASGAYQD